MKQRWLFTSKGFAVIWACDAHLVMQPFVREPAGSKYSNITRGASVDLRWHISLMTYLDLGKWSPSWMMAPLPQVLSRSYADAALIYIRVGGFVIDQTFINVIPMPLLKELSVLVAFQLSLPKLQQFCATLRKYCSCHLHDSVELLLDPRDDSAPWTLPYSPSHEL